MLGTQKSLKNIKKYLEGKAGSSMLSMKVLRYVLAVGFVLAPWLGGEAYATGTGSTPPPPKGDIKFVGDSTNLIATGVAHIHAQNVSGSVGLNRFQTFKVESGEIANLYFQTKGTENTNPIYVNTLVNTVNDRISINGTVNAISNGKIGGNLYFISPQGMIVGTTGVINAGSLTAITTSIDDITDPAKAITAINNASSNSSSRTLIDQPIVIHGQINTVNGIDLRSLSIAISQGSNLNTGMVFETTVNTNGLIDDVTLTSGRSNSTDTKIELCAYKAYIDSQNETYKQFGNITLSGCNVDAIGGILIEGGTQVNINNGSNILSKNNIKIDLEHSNTNSVPIGTMVFNGGKIEAEGSVNIRSGQYITINADSKVISNLVTEGNALDLCSITSNVANYGKIKAKSPISIVAGNRQNISDPASITNDGTILSTGGGMSFAADQLLTNNGLIQASSEIKFNVGDTLTNEGTIESTSSNVQVHIGRDFKNNAVDGTDSSGEPVLKGGIITAGGNVQVDYTLPSGMTAVNTGSAIDGISNSGLIWAKGDVDPTYDAEGNIVSSGSGNIWLTSNYNIENTATGQMIANRQITLNAMDFLHNYGLIQGVTYLDIKSIMGYVYNHASGKIIATGGNIALSSGQENLSFIGNNGQISLEEQEAKKELYRKFTPIIIEGSVEATSDDNNANQTKEGKIEITAHLGDIYINGGTIKTKPKTNPSDDVVAKAGDVIINAAQNITIGFKTESARADDPTTDAKNDSERGYYKPKVDASGNLESGNASTISGTNVTLSAGSINNKKALIGGNLTLDSVVLEGSLTLQGNNMTVSGVQRSDNSSGSLQVVANGVGGTDSAINSLNLNINDNLFFDKLNVNTADINVSGDLQINKLHVADLAHFTSNNTVVGVYGGSTTPTNDQSDALFRDLGNGSTTWMGLTISNGSYSVTNSTQISNSVENLAQMSAKLVDYTPQDSYNEHYGDISGCFERYDIIEAPNRPTGGIAPTAESGGAELKQDENGLHIEMKNNNFEHEMDQRREQDKREGEKEA